MRQSSSLARQRRTAVTLIELIVVLVIVLGLAALTVALAPRLSEQQKTRRAALQLQGWISIARQMARASGFPTGIRLQPGRLLPNPALANANFVTDLQYIQQPPDLVVRPGIAPTDPLASPGALANNVRRIQVVESQPGSGVYNKVVLEKITTLGPPQPGDFSGGYRFSLVNGQPIPNSPDLWPVQPAGAGQLPDYIEINGGGLMHRIAAIGYDPSVAPPQVIEANTLTLQTPLTYPVGLTSQYRIVRRARVLPGEPGLQIGQDVAIDVSPGRSYPDLHFSAANAAPIDILFAPSGALMVSGVGANDKVILWVRDTTLDPAALGEGILISISSRTGAVAAQPVNTDPTVGSGDPYYYTRDGRSSGI